MPLILPCRLWDPRVVKVHTQDAGSCRVGARSERKPLNMANPDKGHMEDALPGKTPVCCGLLPGMGMDVCHRDATERQWFSGCSG